MKLKKVAIAAALGLLLCSCTKPDETMQILLREGYENIEIQGYYPFACSEDDVFSTGFTASKNGQFVEGSVCMGLMKGATIRLLN